MPAPHDSHSPALNACAVLLTILLGVAAVGVSFGVAFGG